MIRSRSAADVYEYEGMIFIKYKVRGIFSIPAPSTSYMRSIISCGTAVCCCRKYQVFRIQQVSFRRRHRVTTTAVPTAVVPSLRQQGHVCNEHPFTPTPRCLDQAERKRIDTSTHTYSGAKLRVYDGSSSTAAVVRRVWVC